MANTFKLNGKTYTAKPFDFNMVCEMEEAGVKLEDFGTHPISMTRCYVALATGMSLEDAGKEIEKTIISGDQLDDIMSAMQEELEKSDFFRALTQTTEEETPKTPQSRAKKSNTNK